VFGIAGQEVDDATVELFRSTGARGLILYRRNFRSAQQVKTLVSTLEERIGWKLLVCLDHEGGRVVFFGEGVTVFPDNYAFGLLGDKAAIRRQGEIEAAELRALGVDINFAPVCDVINEVYNPGILSRSYSMDPGKVGEFITERIRGLQAGGISATPKHFPGKGHATVDAHLGLPVIKSTLKEMEDFHLKPFFAAVKAGTDCIMSSHPLYSNIDDVPATFSRKIITDLLRTKYGFQGVMVSDDLEMGALTNYGGAEAAIVKADRAGHDLLLVCHASTAQEKAYHSLLAAYEDGSLDRRELEKSVERIRRMCARRKNRFDGEVGPVPEGAALAARAANAAATVLNAGDFSLPVKLSSYAGKKAVLVYPNFADMDALLMWEPGAKELDKYFLARDFAAGFKPELCRVPLNPAEADVEKASAALDGADLAIVFVWDAGLSAGWKKVFDAAQARSKKCAAVFLRDFFDARFAKPSTLAATGYGFRKCQLDAVCSKIFAR